jgi:hypothetical protein
MPSQPATVLLQVPAVDVAVYTSMAYDNRQQQQKGKQTANTNLDQDQRPALYDTEIATLL